MRNGLRLTTLLAIAACLLLSFPRSALAAATTEGQRLHALLKSEWQYLLKQDPLVASYAGVRRYNGKWPDLSHAAREARYHHYKRLLVRLAAFKLAGLSHADQINLRLFRQQVGWKVKTYEYGLDDLALNQRRGIQTINRLVDYVTYRSAQDYRDWISRMNSFPAYMDGTIGLLREGMKNHIMQPKVIMRRIPREIELQLVKDPEKSPFYRPFKSFPSTIPPAQRRRLAEEGRAAITRCVVPSYRKLLKFLKTRYIPAAPRQVGALHWPDGKAAYAFLCRRYTTTDLTPEQIHEIGLEQVAHIHAQMLKVMARIGFKGTFKQFLHYMRTNPRFYYRDPKKLLKSYRAFCKRVDPKLVNYFHISSLPRIPYGVEPIPASIAPDTTMAYYIPPAPDGSRAGIYAVNLYKPQTRPKFEIPVLSLHESVPGHHLQIARAMEIKSLPAFRRYPEAFGEYTVYVEGWALYAETLGEPMGFYKNPYDKFGELSFQMWRAVRLVLDTGIHAEGWSRQRAIQYFLDNTPKSRLDITNEVDRYIAWPGQALAYKIGEMKIEQLRRKAKRELGAWFNLKDFHAVVLGSGAVSMGVLQSNVDAWIARVQASWKR